MHLNKNALSVALAALLMALPVAHAAAPTAAFAIAVRAWFDAPAQAGNALEALHAAYPEDDDVAWWLARVRIDQHREAEAASLLVGRVGRKVPAHRFAWLRAAAAERTDPMGARTELAGALRSPGLATDPDRTEIFGLAARLAWGAGDEADTLAHVRAAGGALPGFSIWSRRGPVMPLGVEVDGRTSVVTAGGLVVHGAECVALPASLGEADLWVDGGGAHTENGPVWVGTNALRFTTSAEGVLAVVWEAGAPRLRHAPSPDQPLASVFIEDPPITRATACPSPPAARAHGSPPPPPAHPR